MFFSDAPSFPQCGTAPEKIFQESGRVSMDPPYTLQFRCGKNLLDFLDQIGLTRILQKDRNQSESTRENSRWSIPTKESENRDCPGMH